MKRFFTMFFVTLGVIFFLLILAGVYLFVVDPLNIKPMFFGNDAGVKGVSDTSSSDTPDDKNPILSPSQENALETFGIDPASIPASITPEQEACFTAILGAERVAEIKAGDTPTATEYFKAKSCI